MLHPFKAVFFDAGGTLLHPYPSVGEIYAEVAARFGCKAKPAQLEQLFRAHWLKRDGLAALASHNDEKVERTWWRGLVSDIFTEAGGVRDFDAFFHELYDLFGHPDVWRLYPDVLELLIELKKHKKKTGIISNWDSRLFKICEGLGLTEHFDFILASAVFGASKPNPKIFLEALKRAGVEPHEAVHIGDSVEDDIRGAQALGIQAVLIDRHPKPRAAEHHPTILHFKDLLKAQDV
jgi:putative hydrolase of the HAD superfamily